VAESEVPVGPVRRTHRVYIALPLIVRGADFQEISSTVAVNANGCLVMLKAPVARDDQLWLINPKTVEELPGRVVSLGKSVDGKVPVGIEFSEPSPLFWRINFPPDDWLTSTERKRPASR
jgi:hypothetical protein